MILSSIKIFARIYVKNNALTSLVEQGETTFIGLTSLSL